MNFKQYFLEKTVEVKPKEGIPGYFVDNDVNINDTGWKSGYVDLNADRIGDAKYDFQVFDQIENFDPNMYKGKNVSEGSLRKINLIRPNLFEWIKGPKQQKGKSIISMNADKHYYCLRLDFTRPFGLIYYPKEKSEPKSKPTFRGPFIIGKQIGKVYINSSGQTHPIYDFIKTS